MCPCFLIIHSKQAVGGEVGKIGDGLISWYCKKTETQRIHCNLSTCMQILPVCVATSCAGRPQKSRRYVWSNITSASWTKWFIHPCLPLCACVCVCNATYPTGLKIKISSDFTLFSSRLIIQSPLLPRISCPPASILLPEHLLFHTCRSKEGFAAEASSPC